MQALQAALAESNIARREEARKFAALQSRYQNLQTDLLRAQTQLDKYQQEESKRWIELDALKDASRRASTAMGVSEAALRRQITELEVMLDTERRRSRDTAAALDSSVKDNASTDVLVKRLELQVSALESENKMLRQGKSIVSQELSDTRRQWETTVHEVERFKVEVESDSDKLRVLNSVLRERVSELESTVLALQAQVDAALTSERRAHRKASDLEATVGTLRAQVDAACSNAASTAAADSATIRVLKDRLYSDTGRQRESLTSLQMELDAYRHKLALMTDKYHAAAARAAALGASSRSPVSGSGFVTAVDVDDLTSRRYPISTSPLARFNRSRSASPSRLSVSSGSPRSHSPSPTKPRLSNSLGASAYWPAPSPTPPSKLTYRTPLTPAPASPSFVNTAAVASAAAAAVSAAVSARSPSKLYRSPKPTAPSAVVSGSREGVSRGIPSLNGFAAGESPLPKALSRSFLD